MSFKFSLFRRLRSSRISRRNPSIYFLDFFKMCLYVTFDNKKLIHGKSGHGFKNLAAIPVLLEVRKNILYRDAAGRELRTSSSINNSNGSHVHGTPLDLTASLYSMNAGC